MVSVLEVKKFLFKRRQQFKAFGKPKIFGIGANKTGTTSLTAAMKDFNFTIGNEIEGKKLIEDWSIRNFQPIVKFSYNAEFFQDEPFSLPYTFIALDQAFPGSKFILTERDSPEQWYNSVVNYMSKKWGENGRTPTKEDLQNAAYIEKGWLWKTGCLIDRLDEKDIYNKEILIKRYLNHNESVKEYFRHRPKDLLVLNVAEKDSFSQLCSFLGKNSEKRDFPWKNKSIEI